MISAKDWISLTVQLVSNLADADYQQRVWVLGIGSEVDSWEETCCLFLEHVNPDHFLEQRWKQLGICEKTRDLLLQLETAIDDFDSVEIDPGTIVKNGRWKAVQQLAKNALSELSHDLQTSDG